MKRNSLSENESLARFFVVFFLVFFVTSVILFIIDFVPEKPTQDSEPTHTEQTLDNEQKEVLALESPTRIVISDIGVDTVIENPTSLSVATLDHALLSGAVRYPDSALLGENATMFLFGHQSYLPVVKNKAFKAFNDLQKLEEGDIIRVYSETAVYEYAVRSVSLVEASEALVPLVQGERTLVLSTCNSFGEPGERYVVQADYRTHTTIN